MSQDMNFYSKGNLTNIAKALLKSLDILYELLYVQH